jgi:hypothetical protein
VRFCFFFVGALAFSFSLSLSPARSHNNKTKKLSTCPKNTAKTPRKKHPQFNTTTPNPTNTIYTNRWNSPCVASYWRSWNTPVHKWLLRTVYFPAIGTFGLSRYNAMVLTFFVSAVMHELAIGVPLRMVRGWAFWGIMFQVPLITLTEAIRRRLKSDALGNMIFWCSFCVLGQPVAVLAYFHDYMVYKNAARAAAMAKAMAGTEAVAMLGMP